jgi:hypothetical protein
MLAIRSASHYANLPCHLLSRRNTLEASISSSSDSTGNVSSRGIIAKGKLKRKTGKVSTRSVPKRKVSSRRDAGAWYQREEMMQHEILTKESENDLGNKIVLAKSLRDKMSKLIDEAKIKKEQLIDLKGKILLMTGSVKFYAENQSNGIQFDDESEFEDAFVIP